MSADQDAYTAAQAIPGLTPEQVEYLVSVARGEGYFGLGWNNPSAKTVKDSAVFGLTGKEGAGSNNWGAVQGSGNAGSFFHVDYHADGTPYKGTFRKYATNSDGAADMARILFGGGNRGAKGAAEIKAALAAGDLHAAVLAQHANGYFELAPDKYYTAVVRNYQALSHNVGWPNLLMAPGKVDPLAPEVPHEPLPLSSGFLSSEWGPGSSGVLSESDLLAHAENYLKGTPNGQTIEDA